MSDVKILSCFLFAVLTLLLAHDYLSEKKPEPNSIEITFPAEGIRCVLQDGKIVFCESYKVWREE
jgi:hypothetical protein